MLLFIKNLSISFRNHAQKIKALQAICLSIPSNKIVGIVGESGSGKSITSMAIMGLLPEKGTCIEGEIFFKKRDLLKATPRELQQIRGNEISMIFQEPMSALNPSLTCGFQVAEILQRHFQWSFLKAKKETLSLFEKVKLPQPERFFNSYPHQISGGQMQRVVMSQIADEVVVMYKGSIVEHGETSQIFKYPKEPYTKALLASRPTLNKRLAVLPTISSLTNKNFTSKEVSIQERAFRHKEIYTKPPILEIKNVEKEYYTNPSFFRKKKSVKALNNVSFKVYEGETVGLVGESGCGKSTLGKTILQLEKPTNGKIIYRGKDLSLLSNLEIRQLRKEIQLIFQDPYSSLNPRLSIGRALIEPMKVHKIGTTKTEREERALALLARVGLDASYFSRYPHQLSGGQRQRVGIARTIAMEPKLIVCDESVSALDISVQAQVLNLLNELKEDFGFTYLFISHDLAVVKFMADQLLVMNQGKIEEIGDADEIYTSPKSNYTKKLIEAIPKGV